MSTLTVEAVTFEMVFEEHRTRILRILRKRLDPSFERRFQPEDVLQQVYLRAEARWERRPASMNPFPWLYRIALDCLFDEVKKHGAGRRDCRRDVAWDDQSSAALAGSFTSPSEAASRTERRDRVASVMDSLDDEDARVLTMRTVDELTFPEIAAVLVVNEDRAAYLFLRTKRHFKDEWRSRYPEFEVGQ